MTLQLQTTNGNRNGPFLGRRMKEIVALVNAGYGREEIRTMVGLGDFDDSHYRNPERKASIKRENRQRRVKFNVYYNRALALIKETEITQRPILPEPGESTEELSGDEDDAADQDDEENQLEESVETDTNEGRSLPNNSQWNKGLGSYNAEGPFLRTKSKFRNYEDAALREIKTLICDFIEVKDRDYSSWQIGQIFTNRAGEIATRLYNERKTQSIIDHREAFKIAVEAVRTLIPNEDGKLNSLVRKDLIQLYADKHNLRVLTKGRKLSKTVGVITARGDNSNKTDLPDWDAPEKTESEESDSLLQGEER